MATGKEPIKPGRLEEAANILHENMEMGRIPLIVMGSGISAGVFAPTMREIHEYLAKEIEEKAVEFENDVRKLNEDEQRLVETILALLHQLVSPKPAIWKDDGAPDSPRSVQVRLYNLMQTSRVPCIKTVWQEFGLALLCRKMVGRGGEDMRAKSLPQLEPSWAHIWAAILALHEKVIIASVNYDGLSRKAVESCCIAYGISPRKERKTSRILTTAEEIRGFFTGTEPKLENAPVGSAIIHGLSWKPIPIIKLRGDVFHAICHNTRCPESKKPTPLYFLFPSDPTSSESNWTDCLTEELRCKCCRCPRQLEISFPGVFDKELEIDQELAAFHQFFGAKLAGIIFLGFSGSWDESLVDYLAQRAAKLDVPIISLSKTDTPALQDAAERYFKTPEKRRKRYFQFAYQSDPPPSGGINRMFEDKENGMFLDAKLYALLPIKSPPRQSSAIGATQAAAQSKSEITLRFPDEMPQAFLKKPEKPENAITVHRGKFGDESVLTVKIQKVPNQDETVKLYDAALKTNEFERLQVCSQLGIKGLLLREKNPETHNRFNHSAKAAQIARFWFDVLPHISQINFTSRS